VTIIRLISKNSIEEYILKLADIKLRLDKSISEADGEVDTETEKKNLRELLQNEFNSVE
jgi:SWI/SNF-related matrix-associated actin-dependent regulator 1 of chromatin subfamily A